MRRERVEVIRIDEDNRIYLYSRKAVYKMRKNEEWVVKFVGLTLSSVLQSPVVNENVKKKLEKILENK